MKNRDTVAMENICINSEISAFDEAIKKNNELQRRMEESRLAVEREALKIIDAMSLAFDSKEESIAKMRAWKRTILSESKEVDVAVKSIVKSVSPKNLEQLRELVELVERLNKVDPNILVGKLFSAEV